jgi:hypothetical protein
MTRFAAVACAIVLWPSVARGSDAAAGASPGGEYENSARLAFAGAYQSLFDLSIWGAGLAGTLGREGDRAGGFGTIRYLEARTLGGLVVREASLTGMAEWHWGRGWRAGVGGGFAYFEIVRATTGQAMQSYGPLSVGSLGYDFGRKPNVYVMGTFEVQLQGVGLWSLSNNYTGGGFVLGPALQVGIRL